MRAMLPGSRATPACLIDRAEIMRTYAQQLSDRELRQLAAATAGLSGRDLRDIASRTERTWASKVRSNVLQIFAL